MFSSSYTELNDCALVLVSSQEGRGILRRRCTLFAFGCVQHCSCWLCDAISVTHKLRCTLVLTDMIPNLIFCTFYLYLSVHTSERENKNISLQPPSITKISPSASDQKPGAMSAGIVGKEKKVIIFISECSMITPFPPKNQPLFISVHREFDCFHLSQIHVYFNLEAVKYRTWQYSTHHTTPSISYLALISSPSSFHSFRNVPSLQVEFPMFQGRFPWFMRALGSEA